MNRILSIINKSSQMNTIFQVGFPPLDNPSCGFHSGELVCILGVPSIGKTCLVCNIAKNIAINNKEKVLVVSLDQSKKDIFQRLVCDMGDFDKHKLSFGLISDVDSGMVKKCFDDILCSPLEVIDGSFSTSLLESLILKHCQLSKSRIVIIDSLQSICLPRGIVEPNSRLQYLSTVLRKLKQLSLKNNILIIITSKLSDKFRQEPWRTSFCLSDYVHEDGEPTKNADIICVIHREEYYSPTDNNKGVAQLRGIKWRDTGQKYVFDLKFRNFNRFYSPSKETSKDHDSSI